MSNSYLKIQQEYLHKAWARPTDELARSLPADYRAGCFYFQAFGQACQLCESRILLDGQPATGPEGLLIAMYASFTVEEPVVLHPPRSFKELPGAMPYGAAFAANAERPLAPEAPAIEKIQEQIVSTFSGLVNTDAVSGDFSFTLFPLPRIPLYYIFHLPDDEFPASVTCLFAANAACYMPVDGLADVAEYTGKRLKHLASGLE